MGVRESPRLFSCVRARAVLGTWWLFGCGGLTLLTRVHIFTLPSPNNTYHRSKQQEILAARRDPKKQQEYFKQVNFMSVLLRLIW